MKRRQMCDKDKTILISILFNKIPLQILINISMFVLESNISKGIRIYLSINILYEFKENISMKNIFLLLK